MPVPSHVERHFTSTEIVRDIVIGMSDGLVGVKTTRMKKALKFLRRQ